MAENTRTRWALEAHMDSKIAELSQKLSADMCGAIETKFEAMKVDLNREEDERLNRALAEQTVQLRKMLAEMRCMADRMQGQSSSSGQKQGSSAMGSGSEQERRSPELNQKETPVASEKINIPVPIPKTQNEVSSHSFLETMEDETLMDYVMNIESVLNEESEMVHSCVPMVMIPDETLVMHLNVKCGNEIDNCSGIDLTDSQEINACLENAFQLAGKFDLGFVDYSKENSLIVKFDKSNSKYVLKCYNDVKCFGKYRIEEFVEGISSLRCFDPGIFLTFIGTKIGSLGYNPNWERVTGSIIRAGEVILGNSTTLGWFVKELYKRLHLRSMQWDGFAEEALRSSENDSGDLDVKMIITILNFYSHRSGNGQRIELNGDSVVASLNIASTGTLFFLFLWNFKGGTVKIHKVALRTRLISGREYCIETDTRITKQGRKTLLLYRRVRGQRLCNQDIAGYRTKELVYLSDSILGWLRDEILIKDSSRVVYKAGIQNNSLNKLWKTNKDEKLMNDFTDLKFWKNVTDHCIKAGVILTEYNSFVLANSFKTFLFESSLIVCVTCVCLLSKKQGKVRSRMEKEMTRCRGSRVPSYLTLSEIKEATRGFQADRIIGEGASAVVYEGFIPSHGKGAVKRFHQSQNVESSGESFENSARVPFNNEFTTMLGCLKHRNLVQMKGWCTEKNELILVYEFMSNGSLDKILHSRCILAKLLTWEMRLNIVVGVASALTYLHEECVNQVIHRDVKTCNIMLDSDLNAKLGEFGLASVYLDSQTSTRKASVPVGTMGYLAPEYIFFGITTVKSDVYSFGVVVLEVATGKRPVDSERTVLTDWVWDLWEKGKLLEAADRRLLGRFSRAGMASRMLCKCWTASLDGTIKFWKFPDLVETIPIGLPIYSMVILGLLSTVADDGENLGDVFAYAFVEAVSENTVKHGSVRYQIHKFNLTKS